MVNPQPSLVMILVKIIASGVVVFLEQMEIYGVVHDHNMIVLKIDIGTQSTSLVGRDLGEDIYKYEGGFLGNNNSI